MVGAVEDSKSRVFDVVGKGFGEVGEFAVELAPDDKGGGGDLSKLVAKVVADNFFENLAVLGRGGSVVGGS